MSAGTARQPRRYTGRQLRCMDAMGLTAWVMRPGVAMRAAHPVPARAPSPVAAPVAAARPAEPVEHARREIPVEAVRPAPEASRGVDSAPEPEAPARAPEQPAAPRIEPESVPVPVPAAAPVPTSAPAPRAAAATPPLSARRAAAFERRGIRVVETNPGSGTVLVAVERGAGTRPGLPPLEGEPAELFALMLRSIGLGRTDVSLCALDGPEPGTEQDGTPANAGATGETAGPALRELLGGPRRTVLLLVHDAGEAGPVDVDGDAALRALGVAAFRVPHPTLLLERPVAKREAWAALKAVRRRLGELGPGAGPGPGAGAPGAAR